MIDFLIKSNISLFVLLLSYYLMFQNSKTHQFNRFFLLFSLIFSMVLPFISFEIIQEISKSNIEIGNIQATAIENNHMYNFLEFSVWTIYWFLTLILFIRFILNINKFYSKTKSNEIQVYKNAKLVLLNEKTLPHTFLNFIFINKQDYSNQKIESELFTHELTHVNEKHTLDILFIELLKVIFWFNPIFYFYKKAIQTNHEFLADENVIVNHNNISFYQTLLLTKTNTINYQLASNLNYQLTKKRFVMMTKKDSENINLIKKISLLPILFGLMLTFCVTTIAQTKKVVKTKAFKVATINKANKKVTQKAVYNIDILALPEPTPVNEIVEDNLSRPICEYPIEVKPLFSGGIEAFYKFIGDNYKIPNEPGLKGTIYISFVVEKDGTLTDIKCIRDIGFDTGKEAIRVLKTSRNWSPGMVDGKYVRCIYELPIMIQSPE